MRFTKKQRKHELAVQLAEAVESLCKEPGVVLMNFTGNHITITQSHFDNRLLETAALEAEVLNETYKLRLQTIDRLSQTIRAVLAGENI